jgi:predicted acetylornithine/succinylornithine family transaminase
MRDFTPKAAVVAPAPSQERAEYEHPHLLQNYRRTPINIVRGEGCELIDDRGNRYLDFVAGIAVCALGHAHPAIAKAIGAQAATLVQASNLYHHEPAGMLATELARRSGFGRVFFCNSGAEANEAAIKLARKLAFRKGETERRTILACRGSFHGRSLGTLAATDNPKYQEGFGPLPAGFAFTPFNDIAALDKALDRSVAAFIVEPIQGESGVHPADPAFLAEARRLCSERGALLIFDEIQCGIGRLGTLFAFETFDVRPDVVTIAKALSNGLPIGAMLIDEQAASGLQPGDHGTTFGGSPVPCAAGLAHLLLRDQLDLDAHVKQVGALLWDGLVSLAADFPQAFAPPRGRGLMLGLPVREPFEAKSFMEAARLEKKLLINAAGNNTIRIIPPLIVSAKQIEDGLARLRAATQSVLAASIAASQSRSAT